MSDALNDILSEFFDEVPADEKPLGWPTDPLTKLTKPLPEPTAKLWEASDDPLTKLTKPPIGASGGGSVSFVSTSMGHSEDFSPPIASEVPTAFSLHEWMERSRRLMDAPETDLDSIRDGFVFADDDDRAEAEARRLERINLL
jgi:hypothetical protein